MPIIRPVESVPLQRQLVFRAIVRALMRQQKEGLVHRFEIETDTSIIYDLINRFYEAKEQSRNQRLQMDANASEQRVSGIQEDYVLEELLDIEQRIHNWTRETRAFYAYVVEGFRRLERIRRNAERSFALSDAEFKIVVSLFYEEKSLRPM